MSTRPSSYAWRQLDAKYLDGNLLCMYGCGRVADTGEHIVPYSKGGQDTADNWGPACRRCNSSRGNGPAPRMPFQSDMYKQMKATTK